MNAITSCHSLQRVGVSLDYEQFFDDKISGGAGSDEAADWCKLVVADAGSFVLRSVQLFQGQSINLYTHKEV